MQPSPADTPFDFALLEQTPRAQAGRNRRTLLWLLGLLALLVASVVTLVLYLERFENEEEDRRRVADAQWLEQSVRFHFRRLEDDLTVLARQAATRHHPPAHPAHHTAHPAPNLAGGLLWTEPGVVLTHGWRADRSTSSGAQPWPQWAHDAAQHPSNAEALATLQDTTRGLRRSAYAGPMRRADGTPTDTVWLAVPFFDSGQLVGNYLATLSLEAATQGLVPTWFAQSHAVTLVLDDDLPGTQHSGPPKPPPSQAYLAPMNLAGTDLFLEVSPRGVQPATVPRIFFWVALLFLGGMLVSLYALRRDFIKRQHVQALLQAQVALRTAMESSVTIGLRAWDLSGRILYVNQAFCRLVGYGATELIGRSAPLPYWPADRAGELNLVHRDIIAQGTQHQGVEVEFQHRDGHRVDVLIHESPLNTADGTQIGWMSSVLDISERKRAQRMASLQQDKLEASGRLVAMGEVASTLAHELNQPLGALSSFASGLLNRLRNHSIALEDVVPVVERMTRLAEKAGRIIQRVNAFARRREISRQPLDLVGFARRVLPAAGPTGAPLLDLPRGVGQVWIEADELLLEHVLHNLASNAADWAQRGDGHPKVQARLSLDPALNMATLEVADSGPGVQAADREHIFSAFYSTKDGGMGMGLAICRSIVEAHHGRIEVGRDAALGGARFTVWLPLSGSIGGAPPTAQSATHAPTTPPPAPPQETP